MVIQFYMYQYTRVFKGNMNILMYKIDKVDNLLVEPFSIGGFAHISTSLKSFVFDLT